MVVVGIGWIGLILLGVFDPVSVTQNKPIFQTQAFAVQVDAPHTRRLITPTNNLAGIALNTHLKNGNRDSGIGLLLTSDDTKLGVALSPAGYVTLWEMRGEAKTNHLPWQTWPHVALGRGWNTLQVVFEGEEVEVRVNDELLWREVWKREQIAVDLWGEGYGGSAEFSAELFINN